MEIKTKVNKWDLIKLKKLLHSKGNYKEGEKILFEGIELEGMKDKCGYLSFAYGDYMQLPPENRRKVHPVSDICLIDPKRRG